MNHKNIVCLMHFNESANMLKDDIEKTKWYAYGNPYIDKSRHVFNSGGSLRIEGANFIYSTDPKLINLFNSKEFTIDFWVRYDGVGRLDYETAFSLFTLDNFSEGMNTDLRSLQLCNYNNGRIYSWFGNNVGYWSSGISYNTWYHVAAVFKYNILNTYLNGNLVSQCIKGNKSTKMVVFGGGGGSFQVGLYGNIDEVRICDAAIYDGNFNVNKVEYQYGNNKLYFDKNNMYSITE